MSLHQSSSQHEHIPSKTLVINFDPGYSLRDVLNVLFCHKWKIILFFCTVVSAISVSTYRMPYFYYSEAKIIINAGRDPNKIAPILGPSQHLNQNQQERVNNEVLILKSRVLAEKVVNSIGPENFFKKISKASEQKSDGNIEQLNEQKTNDSTTKKIEQPPKKVETPLEKEIRIKNMRSAAIGQVMGGVSVELKALSFVVGLSVTLRDPFLAQKVLKTFF